MSFENKKILLVEDNEMNMMLAEFALQEFGLEPDEAVNGQEAYDKFLMMPENYYDLVLMDIMMPIVNGINATELIRNSGRADSLTIPIVAMTAESDVKEIASFKDKGFTAYIEKPVDIDELEKILTEVF